MSPRHHHHPLPIHPRRASALVVVLWVIGLLAIIVSSFAFDMHLESRITSYCRKRLKAEYLAQSGLEMVKAIVHKKDTISGTKEGDGENPEKEDSWYDLAKALKYGGAIMGSRQTLGEGEIVLDIIPEPARRNVNKLDERDWENILEVTKVPRDMWDEIIDSFMDWIDNEVPESARPYGAETDDYYSKLKTPYKARNGPLETIDELLLIRGFTNTVVYGGMPPNADENTAPMTGFADLLTTYGDGLVNVNAASKRVLMTLSGVDDVIADGIIEEREGVDEPEQAKGEEHHFKSIDDLFARIPELRRGEIDKKISVGSAIYRINSTGLVQGVRRTISCIVEFNGNEMKILRWHEQEGI